MEDLQQTKNSDEKTKEEYNPFKHGIDEASKIIQAFIKSKYSHDKTNIIVHVITVFILLTGILILSCKMDSAIIGTLFGSLIGFAFGNFPKNNKGGKSD